MDSANIFRGSVLLMAAVLVSGCAVPDVQASLTGDRSRLVLVLVDLSGTVPESDWHVYRQVYSQVIDAARAGDRVVLASIDGATLTAFRPVADLTLANSGVALSDEETATVQRLKLRLGLDEMRQRPAANRSHILDAAVVASHVFRGDPERLNRHLVILSDMLEESDDANFRLRPPGVRERATLIERLRRAGRLPDLNGAKVHVVGATGRSAAVMAQIEEFWREYFVAVGAPIQPGGYSRAASVVRLANE